MILKIIGIFSAIVGLQGANGASYSKVYVQSGGPDVLPIEYINYGAPAVIAEPQIARLSAAPTGSVVPPVPGVIQPCVSPCIVGQNIAPVAPVPNAKFITYNAPNVPVVVAPSKDNGYEYSYIVYDENTGDKKAQREFSDGSVVRGEYSFIQPDGFVREVQYRADDLSGFNVVVKRIPPETVGIVEKKQEKVEPPPCKEVKSEALKEEPKHELAESNEPANEHGHDAPEPVHPIENHDHNHDGKPDHEPSKHGKPEEPAHDVEEVHTHEEIHEAPPAEHVPEPEVHVPEPNTVTEHAPEPEHHEEEHHEKPAPETHEEAHKETLEAIVVPDEQTPAAVIPVLPVPVPEIPVDNQIVSYEDIIRCIQSRSKTQQGFNVSPLTYIILPGANRPC